MQVLNVDSKTLEIEVENDIALAASGYLLARIGALIAFGYLVYRVLRPAPNRARVRARPVRSASQQSRYARERHKVTRLQR